MPEPDNTNTLRDIEDRILRGVDAILQDSQECTYVYRYSNTDYQVTLYGEPFGEMFKVVRAKAVPRDQAQAKDDDPQGAKARGVAEAIADLWPEAIPAGLAAKERNRMITDWLTSHGHSVPGERVIQRVLSQKGGK